MRPRMSNAFTELALRPELLDALAQVGYVAMTPIQAEALPPALSGNDVTGEAQTGSGKTAAFALALLNTIDPSVKSPQAMVLCPTRELADQVAAEIRALAQRLANTRVLTLCGGRPIWEQTNALGNQCQVVVGTPGRIGDHLKRGSLKLGLLGVLVIDEADRMLQMGFLEQVSAIISACPRDRQTLLFSATFPREIEQLSARTQQQPTRVTVQTRVEPNKLRQLVVQSTPEDRNQTIADLLGHYRPPSALVFCETRVACDEVARTLTELGAVALPLHGEMEQRDRTQVLLQFVNGSASVLVATNVAARGIDIPALPLVIVSELSREPESHIHRVGRTGRAGEEGLALTIVASGREHARLGRVEKLMGLTIPDGPPIRPTRELDFMHAPNRTLLLLSGRRDKLRKGDVLGALVKDGGIPAESIGRIDLMDKSCAIAIARADARDALRYVQGARIKKQRVRALLL